MQTLWIVLSFIEGIFDKDNFRLYKFCIDVDSGFKVKIVEEEPFKRQVFVGWKIINLELEFVEVLEDLEGRENIGNWFLDVEEDFADCRF